MKDRILKVGELLRDGKITELESRNLLLNLFSNKGFLPDFKCKCKELNAVNRICQKCSGVVIYKDTKVNNSRKLSCPDCKGKNIDVQHKSQIFKCRDCKNAWAN